MPWNIVQDHGECSGWAVVKEGSGEVEGCHDTREDAVAQLAALNASERGETRSVKILSEDDKQFKVGGYGVVFGGRDLEGEFFTKDTDFWFDRISETPMVLYDHGMDGSIKRMLIGEVEKKTVDDVGLWVEAQIRKHDDYTQAIQELINKNKLGWSSGAVHHLVERGKAGQLKSWPIVEFSLTPTPAEPRTLGVKELRSLVESEPSLKVVMPEETTDEVVSDATTIHATVKAGQRATLTIDHGGDGKMDELIKSLLADKRCPFDEERLKSMTEAELQGVEAMLKAEKKEEPTKKETPSDDGGNDERLDSLESTTRSLSESVTNLVKLMQDSPAIRKAGYFTEDGGTNDKDIKSFGDYLLAVMRGDGKRLREVYKSTKDMSGVDGTGGGYLVPTEFSNQIVTVAGDAAVVRPRAFTYPAQSDRGQIPALDHYTAPTAGQGDTAFAGGVVMTWSSEGATDGETQPTFALVDYNVHKLKAFTEVPNELLADSAVSVEALLTRLFGVAIAGMEDYAFLRGDGVGKPLGILNADAALAVAPDTNNTFAFADAAEMLSRFHPLAGSRPVWLMHRSTIPDLTAFEVSTGSGGVWIANLAQDIPQTLFGYPILYSEHLPQANSSGHVILADLSAYAIFDRVGASMSIAFSEHASFTADKGTWRVVKRLDGQPWVKNVITLAGPGSAYTVSPFVYFND